MKQTPKPMLMIIFTIQSIRIEKKGKPNFFATETQRDGSEKSYLQFILGLRVPAKP